MVDVSELGDAQTNRRVLFTLTLVLIGIGLFVSLPGIVDVSGQESSGESAGNSVTLVDASVPSTDGRESATSPTTYHATGGVAPQLDGVSSDDESWPQFGFDGRNGGWIESAAEPTAPVVEAWRYETGDTIGSSPVVADGTVYVGITVSSSEGRVLALDAETGEEAWNVTAGGHVESTPAVHDGVVYVGTDAGSLLALDAVDGTEHWNEQLGDQINSPVTVDGGVVYVGDRNERVSAFNATTGDVVWQTTVDGEIRDSAVAVADGVAYAVTDDGFVYALDALDGSEVWDQPYHRDAFSGSGHSPVVTDGSVFVGTKWDSSAYEAHLLSIDASTGTETWNYTLSGISNTVHPPSVANGTVFFGSGDDNFYAVDAVTGSDAWDDPFETENSIQSSPAIVGDTVVFGSREGGGQYGPGAVYALDADTGDVRWEFETERNVEHSPAVVDGVVYAADNQRIYAIESEEADDPVDDGPIEIDSCTVITDAGEYRLTQDLHPGEGELGDQARRCVEINADDVTFDGMGHTINGSNVLVTNEHSAVSARPSSDVTDPANRISNVTVRNVTTEGWRYGVDVRGVEDGEIADVTPRKDRGQGDHGIYVRDSASIDVHGVVVRGETDELNAPGIAFTRVAGGEIYDNNVSIYRPLSGSVSVNIHSITTYDSDNLHIHGNTLSNEGADEDEIGGVRLRGTNDSLVTDNVFRDMEGVGIVAEGSQNSNLTVAANELSNTGGTGILLVSADGATVENNVLGPNHHSPDGIRVESDDVLVSGNDVTQYGAAVRLAEADDVTVQHNAFETNWQGVLAARSSGVTVRNNTVTGNTFAGIDVRGRMGQPQSDSEITGNRLDGNTVGISVSDFHNVTIASNVIAGSEDPGVEITFSEAVSLEDTHIADGDERGIALTDSDNVSLQNVTVTGHGIDDSLSFVEIDAVENATISALNVSSNGAANVRAVRLTDASSIAFDDLEVVDNPATGFVEYGVVVESSTDVSFDESRIHAAGRSLDVTDDSTDVVGTNVSVGGDGTTALTFDAQNVYFGGNETPPAPDSGLVPIGTYLETGAYEFGSAGSFLDLDVPYEDDDVAGIDEGTLALYAYEETGNGWSKVATSSVDPAAQVVEANLTAFATVGVFAEGDGPTAWFTADPADPIVGESVTFDASASSATDDSIVEYRWDFDGDGTVDTATDDPVVTHAFDASGTFEVGLEVADAGGQTAESSESISVAEPTAEMTVVDVSVSTTEVETGDSVTVTADVENTGDGDGEYVATLEIGGVAEDSTSINVPAGSTATAEFTRTFSVASTYELSVDGVTAGTVTVTEPEPDPAPEPDPTPTPPPSDPDPEPVPEPEISVTDATLSASTVDVGGSVDISATIENAGDGDGSHTLTATVDDDVVETETVSVDAGEAVTASISVTFDEAGTFDVALDGDTIGTVVVESEPEPDDPSEPDETDPDDEPDEEADDSIPGFGVVGAIVATIFAAALRSRKPGTNR